jgi:hypothetical protein
MTDQKPMRVAGYTGQTQSNVDLANELKFAEERYLRLLDNIGKMTNGVTPDPVFDQRFLALARTHMQTANMFAVRSIFQPQRVQLPED